MDDTLKILDTFNGFYTNAFTQLIILTVGILALAGVVVPLIIGYYQARQLKIQHQSLIDRMAAQVREQIEIIKAPLEAQLKKLFDEEVSRFKAEVERLEEQLKISEMTATARAFHLQANISQNKNEFVDAVNDSLIAATAYAKGGEEGNMQRALNLMESALENLSKEHFEQKASLDQNYKEFTEAIIKINVNSRYEDLCSRLDFMWREAKRRVISIPQETP